MRIIFHDGYNMNRSNGQWFHELPSLMICFKSRQHHTHQSYCHCLQKILLNKVHLHDVMLRNPPTSFHYFSILLKNNWNNINTICMPVLTFDISIGADR